MKNPFLTEIAKDYNPKIEGVYFFSLEGNINGSAHVCYWDEGLYYISIDNKKLHCAYQIFFVLFHEIAHIQLSHFDGEYNNKRYTRENEANQWAFEALNMIDSINMPTADNILCYKCVTTWSAVCLKHKT